MFNEAKRLIRNGIGVIPTFDGKKYDMRGLRSRGYNAVADLRDRLPTDEDLKFWFASPNRRRGFAIVTGSVVCLDFDTQTAYQEFCETWPAFSHTWTVQTRRGYHLYYQVTDQVTGPVEVALGGVELKHSGASVATAGPGYQTVSNGLLNDRTMMVIRDVFVLPVVEAGQRERAAVKKKTFFSTKSIAHDNPIGQIKKSIPISQYLESLGHELIPYGATFSMACPFHEDKKPSFWIIDDKQICNCHTCGGRRPMDILNLHQRLNNCDVNEAVKDLAGMIQ